MRSFNVTSVATVLCQTSDMDRAVVFYRDVLGLTPGHVSPHWSDFVVGNLRIGIHPAFEGAELPQSPSGRGWILGLQVDDLKNLRERLESSGAAVTGDYHDIPGGVLLDFVDPDGNPLQAIQLGATAKDLTP